MSTIKESGTWSSLPAKWVFEVFIFIISKYYRHHIHLKLVQVYDIEHCRSFHHKKSQICAEGCEGGCFENLKDLDKINSFKSVDGIFFENK